MPIFTRSFEIGPRERDLVLQVAHLAGGQRPFARSRAAAAGEVVLFGSESRRGRDGLIQHETTRSAVAGMIAVGLSSPSGGFQWSTAGAGNLRLTVPKGPETLRLP